MYPPKVKMGTFMKKILVGLISVALVVIAACSESTDEKKERGNRAIHKANVSYVALLEYKIDLYKDKDAPATLAAAYTDEDLRLIALHLKNYIGGATEALQIGEDRRVKHAPGSEENLRLGRERAKALLESVNARIEERRLKKNEPPRSASA
jgi:hypothetical protein